MSEKGADFAVATQHELWVDVKLPQQCFSVPPCALYGAASYIRPVSEQCS
jgi:hypothetical protein